MLMPGQRGSEGTLSGILNCRYFPAGHAGGPRRDAGGHTAAATADAPPTASADYGDRCVLATLNWQ